MDQESSNRQQPEDVSATAGVMQSERPAQENEGGAADLPEKVEDAPLTQEPAQHPEGAAGAHEELAEQEKGKDNAGGQGPPGRFDLTQPVLKNKERKIERLTPVAVSRPTTNQEMQREMIHRMLNESPDFDRQPNLTSDQILTMANEMKKKERAKYIQNSSQCSHRTSSMVDRSNKDTSSRNVQSQLQEQSLQVQSQPQQQQQLDPNTINWSETPLYDYYLQNQSLLDVHQLQQIGQDAQSGYLAWHPSHFTDQQVDQLLNKIRADQSKYEDEKVHAPIYVQAMVTLKYLFEEQQVDQTKLLKVRQLYGTISLDNTVKLLLRCKIIFAARLALMDVFDTINRLKVSDDLLKNYITEAVAAHYQMKKQSNGTRKDELALDQELRKGEKSLVSLISIFVSVAEELNAKIDMVVNGQHRNLKDHQFVLMGRIVNTQWIQRKIRDQEERLKRDWPAKERVKAFKFQMRPLKVVKAEIESNQEKMMQKLQKKQALKEKRDMQIQQELQQQMQNQSRSLQSNVNSSMYRPDTDKMDSLYQDGNEEQHKTLFNPDIDLRELNGPMRYQRSVTDSAVSPRLSQGGANAQQEEAQLRPQEAKQFKRVVIREDASNNQRLLKSRAKSRGKKREPISRWNAHELNWQSYQINQMEVVEEPRGDTYQTLDGQRVMDKSPLDYVRDQQKSFQKRSRSNKRSESKLAQIAVYEKLPQPSLNARLQHKYTKKASKSPNSIQYAVNQAVFGPPNKYQTLNKVKASQTPRHDFSFKIRHQSNRPKKSRGNELEKYGFELVDKTKAQFLIEKMNNQELQNANHEDMTLEKYSFKMIQRKEPKNQRMTSRKSTAENESSQMKAGQDRPESKPFGPNGPSINSFGHSKSNLQYNSQHGNFQKNLAPQRPETQGAVLNIEINSELNSKPGVLGHHRRIGTVGGMLNGRIPRPMMGAIKDQKIPDIGSGSISNSLTPKRLFSEQLSRGGKHRSLRPMTKGTTDEFIPESSEMDLTQKDQNIAILNEEAAVGQKEKDEEASRQVPNDKPDEGVESRIIPVPPDEGDPTLLPEVQLRKYIQARGKSQVQELKKLVEKKKQEIEQRLKKKQTQIEQAQAKQSIRQEYIGNQVVRQFEKQGNRGSLHDSLLSTISEVEKMKEQIFTGGVAQSTHRVLPSGETSQSILNDGRQFGFNNPKLVLPVERSRSTIRQDKLFLNTFLRNRRSIPNESAKICATQRSEILNQIDQINNSLLRTRRDENSNEQRMQSQDNADGNNNRGHKTSATQSKQDQQSAMERSSFISVQDKVLQLQNKLQEFGIQIPDEDLDRLEKLKQDMNSQNQWLPNSYQTFVPPFGGHTRNSQVREEIQSLYNFQRQMRIKNSLSTNRGSVMVPPEEPREIVPLQAQMNRERRIARYNQIDPNERAGQVSNRVDYQLQENVQNHSAIEGKRSRTSAVSSLFQGNNRQVMFSTYYSNVWLPPNGMMYQDSRLSAERIREEREANILRQNLQFQLKKYENMKSKRMKDQMSQFYFDKFGLTVPQQKQQVLTVEELREVLMSKANMVYLNAAATKIQRWYKRRYFINMTKQRTKQFKKSIIIIQRRFRYWKNEVRDPAKYRAKQEAAVALIQRCLRGYQVRRRVEYLVLDARADKLWEYWEKIERIMKGHLQRRVRRAWLAYKAAQEEKKRKEEEAKKKAMQGRRRAFTKASVPSTPSSNLLRASTLQQQTANNTPRRVDTQQSSKEQLEPYKNKSAVVEGSRPNPDINSGPDVMENTMQFIGAGTTDNQQNTELKSVGEHSGDVGATFQNEQDGCDDREPPSQQSSVVPTPRDGDPGMTPDVDRANSQALSLTQEVPRNSEALGGPDGGKDVSLTMREPAANENGHIVEEREETARDDLKEDDESDDIQRATDQETVMKMGQEAVNQKLAQDLASQTQSQLQMHRGQPQTSKCSLCKEEKTIEELEFVDESTIKKIESLTTIKQKQSPERKGACPEVEEEPPSLPAVNAEESPNQEGVDEESQSPPSQPGMHSRSQEVSQAPDSTRHSPDHALMEQQNENETALALQQNHLSERSVTNVQHDLPIQDSINQIEDDQIIMKNLGQIGDGLVEQGQDTPQLPENKSNSSSQIQNMSTPKLGVSDEKQGSDMDSQQNIELGKDHKPVEEAIEDELDVMQAEHRSGEEIVEELPELNVEGMREPPAGLARPSQDMEDIIEDFEQPDQPGSAELREQMKLRESRAASVEAMGNVAGPASQPQTQNNSLESIIDKAGGSGDRQSTEEKPASALLGPIVAQDATKQKSSTTHVESIGQNIGHAEPPNNLISFRGSGSIAGGPLAHGSLQSSQEKVPSIAQSQGNSQKVQSQGAIAIRTSNETAEEAKHYVENLLGRVATQGGLGQQEDPGVPAAAHHSSAAIGGPTADRDDDPQHPSANPSEKDKLSQSKKETASILVKYSSEANAKIMVDGQQEASMLESHYRYSSQMLSHENTSSVRDHGARSASQIDSKDGGKAASGQKSGSKSQYE